MVYVNNVEKPYIALIALTQDETKPLMIKYVLALVVDSQFKDFEKTEIYSEEVYAKNEP